MMARDVLAISVSTVVSEPAFNFRLVQEFFKSKNGRGFSLHPKLAQEKSWMSSFKGYLNEAQTYEFLEEGNKLQELA